jgi:2'-5' RNA ligase
MDEDSLHLTLAFLGDIPADLVESVLQAANDLQQEAFTLQLDQLAHWPHNRIVWAGCCKPPVALTSLADTLQNRLRQAGFTIESRPFTPHVTLLRNCRQATAVALAPLYWPAREFVLVESLSPADRNGDGHYRIIGRLPLFATPKKTRG